MGLDGGAHEAVASNDKPEAVSFLEISSGHCRIYWRFTFCIILMLK